MALLRELEQYVLRQACEIENMPLDEARKNLKFILVTETGSQEREGLDDATWSYFPEDIASCTLLYSSGSTRKLRVALTFSQDKSSNVLAVTITGNSAQEIIDGLLGGIERIVGERSSPLSGWLQNEWMKFASVIGGIALVAYAANQWSSARGAAISGMIGLALLILLYKSRPYTAFKTRKTEFLLKISNYVLAGLLGALLLGLIALNPSLDWLR